MFRVRLGAAFLFSCGIPSPGFAQSPADAAPRANAAVVYGKAVAEVCKRLEIADYDEIGLPRLEAGSPAGWRFGANEWNALIEAAAPAIALFAQAARLPTCDFGPGKAPVSTGYDDCNLLLTQLAYLVAAHGWRQLVTAPESAYEDAATLLQHARQVARQPTRTGWRTGFVVEGLALALLRESMRRAPNEVVRACCRAALREHEGRRPHLADLAEGSEVEVARMLRGSVATLAERLGDPGTDLTTRMLVSHSEAIEKRTLDLVHEALEPLRRSAPPSRTEVMTRGRQLVERLREGTGTVEVESALPHLSVPQVIDVLSRQSALVLLPDLLAMVQGESAAQQLLQECRALAEQLPESR